MKNNKAEIIEDSAIEVDEELRNTQRSWALQKVAWIFLLVMIVLLCLGLFGDGALSFQSETRQQYNIQYDRYFRYQAEKSIRIASHGPDIKTVSVSQSLTNGFRVSQIVPVPVRSYIENNNRVYQFNAEKNRVIVFYVSPMESGTLQGSVWVNNVSFPLKHFIYP